MANSPQARKRARQNDVRRTRNASQRSMVRTYIKKVEAAIQAGDSGAARTALNDAIPIIDRMATRGIMHRNKAARHKSRLNQRINKLDA